MTRIYISDYGDDRNDGSHKADRHLFLATRGEALPWLNADTPFGYRCLAPVVARARPSRVGDSRP